MGLTAQELRYLEACMQVADGEGEHAAEFGLDYGALQVKLIEMITNATVEGEAEKWRDAEDRGMKEKK